MAEWLRRQSATLFTSVQFRYGLPSSILIGGIVSNDWVWGSGRKGSPKVPAKKIGEKKMKCPKCGQEGIQAYPDGTIERHKVFKKDRKGNAIKKGAWFWCPQKRWN